MAAKKQTKKPAETAIVPVTRVSEDIKLATRDISEGLRTTAKLLEQRLSPEGYSAVTAYLKRVGKMVDSQEKTATGALKSYLSTAQDQTVEMKMDESGARMTSKTLRAPFADRTVVATLSFPRAHAPDEALTEALLRGKDLPLEVGCDQVVSYVPNKTKLEALVKKGKLTQEEYDGLFKPGSPTLKVSEEEVTL